MSPEDLVEFVPASWTFYIAPIIPLMVFMLAQFRREAQTSAWKALAAVGLSTVLAVIEAVTDGRPDTVQSVALVAWTFLLAQFPLYEVIWKRLFEMLDLQRADTDQLDDEITETGGAV